MEPQIASTVVDKPSLDDDSLISSLDARRQMLGGISVSTEYRWELELEGFPKPIRIHGRKFYRVGDLREFARIQAAA
jgi:hypothetical protein